MIEGYYSSPVNARAVRQYIHDLSERLKMTIIYGPVVKNLAGKLFPKHAGLEAIAIWAESGLSVYTWEKDRFFTVDIYACKRFPVGTTVDFTRRYFGCKAEEIVFKKV